MSTEATNKHLWNLFSRLVFDEKMDAALLSVCMKHKHWRKRRGSWKPGSIFRINIPNSAYKAWQLQLIAEKYILNKVLWELWAMGRPQTAP